MTPHGACSAKGTESEPGSEMRAMRRRHSAASSYQWKEIEQVSPVLFRRLPSSLPQCPRVQAQEAQDEIIVRSILRKRCCSHRVEVPTDFAVPQPLPHAWLGAVQRDAEGRDVSRHVHRAGNRSQRRRTSRWFRQTRLDLRARREKPAHTALSLRNCAACCWSRSRPALTASREGRSTTRTVE